MNGSQPHTVNHIVVPQGARFLAQGTCAAPVPCAAVPKKATSNAKLLADLTPVMGSVYSAYHCENHREDGSTNEQPHSSIALCNVIIDIQSQQVDTVFT